MTSVGATQQSESANRSGLHSDTLAANATSGMVVPTEDDIAYVHAVVRNAGSSFYGAMRTLPTQQREAMFAIYAYCREIDDIAAGLPVGIFHAEPYAFGALEALGAAMKGNNNDVMPCRQSADRPGCQICVE